MTRSATTPRPPLWQAPADGVGGASRPVRRIEPGTPGWTIDDFADPRIPWPDDGGGFEIVDGVLTSMAPPGAQGTDPVMNLRDLLRDRALAAGQQLRLLPDTDLLLHERRVPRPDLTVLTPAQWARQRELERERGITDARQYRPIFVMPALVVECLSEGRAAHDRVTKRQWYAEARIPHYWLLDPADFSLECLLLDGPAYAVEARGARPEVVRSAFLGGVDVPLAQVWQD